MCTSDGYAAHSPPGLYSSPLGETYEELSFLGDFFFCPFLFTFSFPALAPLGALGFPGRGRRDRTPGLPESLVPLLPFPFPLFALLLPLLLLLAPAPLTGASF